MPVVDHALDRRPAQAQYGHMSKSPSLQERFERQKAELLLCIQMQPRVSTAELAHRTGMSAGVVCKRLAVLKAQGKVTVNHDLRRSVSATARSRSLDERISTLERVLGTSPE
jgi:Winged helix-turn-helix DNA-binding